MKEWRLYREMTQADLAAKIGVAISTISQLERFEQGYSQATLEALAEALRCEPGDLLMINPMSDGSVWRILERLSPEDRQQVARIADTFKR